MLVPIILALKFIVPLLPSAYSQSNNEISIVSGASELANKAFDPNPMTINQGKTMIWTNKDFGIHTVTEDQGLFSSKDFDQIRHLDLHLTRQVHLIIIASYIPL